ncbi:S-adenosyl-L-methionine-dependent methyltransferase [Piptocephalis cylindrospora]|uniref:Arginine N-methyltransferase 2 n=1 Tax=Piptocephalis cylindrospora TaxID=1907219 RepID=A0A4P9XY91_9FUNG|nr:S-adenosyl-L-methionine-dependent methyltransferase [Piptocephalis cylindrospora]|eukprot:RKP11375.1 S-adenosyl-L-methionine-dependent methyltransferase [Piptocephalis cylindrospora]
MTSLSAVYDLAEKGDVSQLKEYLKTHKDDEDFLTTYVTYQREEDGDTALHAACRIGSTGCARALLRAGHPWNAMNRSGVTAAEVAKASGHQDLWELIVEEGVRVEMIMGLLGRKNEKEKEEGGKVIPNQEYLEQPLTYTEDRLVDADGLGVMLGWEEPLMRRHAEILCPRPGLDVLNVGFGLGLIDEHLQRFKPRTHTIIEAHPDVYRHMLDKGWDKRPGVRILHGRWQDVLPQLAGEDFDGIYFDTYGEYYADMREWHEEVTNLLRPDGIYSFFNGLAATNPVFHEVSCRLAETELRGMGLATTWESMPMDPEEQEEKNWGGLNGRYWTLKEYRLPTCRFDL